MDITEPGQIRLAVLDMAGTTVNDAGSVESAFLRAMAGVGITGDDHRLPRMLDYVRATMGTSKIAVFTSLLDGDRETAAAANRVFEQAYAEHATSRALRPVDGAVSAMQSLRDNGIKVALTTGFSASTQAAVLDALGWRASVDLALAPGDGVRGRPYPDLALTALMRTGVADVREMIVVGDTTSDILSGRRAGAARTVGVLTGAHDEAALRRAGASDVIGSIAALPALLGLTS